MRAPETIGIVFGRDVPAEIRPRITYALRVFAAVYGYGVVNADREVAQADRLIRYGGELPPIEDQHGVDIPRRYVFKQEFAAPQKLSRYRYGKEEIPLFYGLDPASGKPDWLGEIFAWLSSSHERGVKERDAVGRIPYSKSIFSEEKLSPRKPYASLLMAWLQHTLNSQASSEEFLPKAPSPIPGVEHAVICSQDIDFYDVRRMATLVRLVKNLGIAAMVSRSWPFFSSNAVLLLQLLTGRKMGDYLPELARTTAQRNIHSTMFVISRRGHRRDANYELAQIASLLLAAQKQGHSIELHGSYTSIIEGGGLSPESAAMQEATGCKPKGNRQHWLRFDDHEKLYKAVAGAGMSFDSTLGFSETVGFRNGASFAFPPYDFQNECPFDFLEIPLVLMDVSLEAAAKNLDRTPQSLAEEVLQESRRFGWGGVSVLWHNPLEPLHVPQQINQVFWDCAPAPGTSGEQWMSANEFITQSLPRYHRAGLLEGVRVNA